MVKSVWKTRGIPSGNIDKAVTAFYASKFFTGMEEGFGKKLSELDYDTPDHAMLKALQESVWHFASAKNYTQLVDLSRALVGPDGKLRSFRAFKAAAEAINGPQINQWLKTEYNLAVTGGQMASKWLDIERNAEALPLLEFDAVIDSHTTDLCRSLNGTILPFDHPFWAIYYLPNHFGERSTVRSIARGKVTPASEIPSAEIPEMFKINLAKERLAFPPKHPYFNDNPGTLKQDSKTLLYGQ